MSQRRCPGRSKTAGQLWCSRDTACEAAEPLVGPQCRPWAWLTWCGAEHTCNVQARGWSKVVARLVEGVPLSHHLDRRNSFPRCRKLICQVGDVTQPTRENGAAAPLSTWLKSRGFSFSKRLFWQEFKTAHPSLPSQQSAGSMLHCRTLHCSPVLSRTRRCALREAWGRRRGGVLLV